MKIIELLNKIANGEEVPQKIKVGNKIYNYETFNIGKGDNYFTGEWEEVKGYRINYDGTYYYLEIRDYNLNDTVEIIEEDKKIEKIEDLNSDYYVEARDCMGFTKEIALDIKTAKDKINEIIDVINKGD